MLNTGEYSISDSEQGIGMGPDAPPSGAVATGGPGAPHTPTGRPARPYAPHTLCRCPAARAALSPLTSHSEIGIGVGPDAAQQAAALSPLGARVPHTRPQAAPRVDAQKDYSISTEVLVESADSGSSSGEIESPARSQLRLLVTL